jgi:glutamate dehydrogenase (NAD(P)+)
MSFFWDEDEVNGRLKTIITKAFENVYKFQQEKQIDMRLAAMSCSVQRLERAMLLRGLYPR